MKTIAITLSLLTSGCLVRNLRTPAEDHAVQASAVAQSCEADGYGEGKCTQADLDAMAQQARCVNAAIRGKRCAEESGK